MSADLTEKDKNNSTDQADLTEEDKKKFTGQLGPILEQIAPKALMGLGGMALQMIVTNYVRNELVGDFKAKPSENETTVNKAEVAGNETEGKVSKDGVNGTEGKIKANETKGIASTAEATAADNGAQALRNKTGALDIESKGMEIQ